MKPEVLKSWSLEIDYSRAPCLGADQKARGLWERDCVYFNISVCDIGTKLKPHGSVCPPFTHGRVVWRPVVSILMKSPFSDSIVFSVHLTLENSVFKKHCFQIAPQMAKAYHGGRTYAQSVVNRSTNHINKQNKL